MTTPDPGFAINSRSRRTGLKVSPGYPCAFSRSISHNILRILLVLGISAFRNAALRSLRHLSAAQYIAPLTSTPLSAAQCSAVRRFSTAKPGLKSRQTYRLLLQSYATTHPGTRNRVYPEQTEFATIQAEFESFRRIGRPLYQENTSLFGSYFLVGYQIPYGILRKPIYISIDRLLNSVVCHRNAGNMEKYHEPESYRKKRS